MNDDDDQPIHPPSPWSRGVGDDLTWVDSPAPRPPTTPTTPSAPTASVPPVPPAFRLPPVTEPDPSAWDEPDEPPTPTGWGRRSLAAGVLIAFVVAFVAARMFAGPGTSGIVQGPTYRYPVTNSVPTTQADVSADTATIAAKVQPGVVDINTVLAFQHAAAAGTGMVLTPTGQILTNNHVIDGATSITATVVDTGKTYTATVVGSDPSDDIAVLQLDKASGLKTVPLGDSNTVQVGDKIVTLGNAGGVGGQPSIKDGTVEGVGQTIFVGEASGGGSQRLDNLIVVTAPLQSGDSGGPLINDKGQVIGIDTAASENTGFRGQGASLGFAIPIADAMAIVHQIESGQASDTVHIGPTAFLGVSLLPQGDGAVVTSVASGSPAADAGLEQGDTITSAGGQSITSADSLSTVIQAHQPGDKVALKWTDPSGDDHTATVKLATGPAA